MEPVNGSKSRGNGIDPRRRRALGVFTLSVACVGAFTAFLNGSFLGAAQSSPSVSAASVQPSAEPRTVRVPVDHATIQQAIDASPDGSTILVSPGLYRERVVLDGRSLHLLGMGGAGATQVVGDGSSQPIAWIRDGANRIEGITFEGGRGETGRGASVQRGSSQFVGCRFVRNAGGVEATDARVSFDGCDFTGNKASFAGGAVLARRSEAHFERCRIEANVATTFGGGIGLMDGEATLQETAVVNNRVSSGAWGGGLYGDHARVLVQGGAFEGNSSAESGPAAFLSGGSGTFRGVRFGENRSEGGWVVHGSEGVSLSLEGTQGEAGRILTADEAVVGDEVALADTGEETTEAR